MKKLNIIFLLCLLILFVGCDRMQDKSKDLIDRGVRCVESKDYDKALELYKQAIKKNPESENAYLHMAILYDEYLGDKTNAIRAYWEYLKISDNEINKRKVKEWIKVAAKNIDKPPTVISSSTSEGQADREDGTDYQEMQFAAVRQKYEEKIDGLKNELFDSKNQCAKLSNENIALRLDDKNSKMTDLLVTIESNDLSIAILQTELEAKYREVQAALQSQETFQSIITNLQASLKSESINNININELISSNSYLAASNYRLKKMITEVIKEKEYMQMHMEGLSDKYMQMTTSPPVIVTNKPAIPLTPELLQAFENTKTEIVELKRRERFNRQERVKFIETIDSLRKQLSSSDSSLMFANRRIDKGTKANAEVKLQYKKLLRSYDALKRQYLSEVRKRQKINSAISDIQKEIGGGNTVAPAPVASAQKYTVKRGDTLKKISEKVYGDENKWKSIYKANIKTLKDANRLRIGQELIIP